ncbi:unnamed protein product, partial [Sphacelaria rigidula]
HLNYRYLTPNQCEERGRMFSARVGEGRLRQFNLMKKVMRIAKNLDTMKRFVLFLSKNDVPGLRRHMAQMLKEGYSPLKMLAKLQEAVEGLYSVRGYGTDEVDLAILVLRLGGPALLFTLHQTSGLPGISTVRRHMK